MDRNSARQKQIDAKEAGEAVVGKSLEEAHNELSLKGFTPFVDWIDGEPTDLMAGLTLTVGRVRLQIEDNKVVGYAVG
jgi:hypothetical protein